MIKLCLYLIKNTLFNKKFTKWKKEMENDKLNLYFFMNCKS